MPARSASPGTRRCGALCASASACPVPPRPRHRVYPPRRRAVSRRASDAPVVVQPDPPTRQPRRRARCAGRGARRPPVRAPPATGTLGAHQPRRSHRPPLVRSRDVPPPQRHGTRGPPRGIVTPARCRSSLRPRDRRPPRTAANDRLRRSVHRSHTSAHTHGADPERPNNPPDNRGRPRLCRRVDVAPERGPDVADVAE
jgi:hypothetical protein